MSVKANQTDAAVIHGTSAGDCAQRYCRWTIRELAGGWYDADSGMRACETQRRQVGDHRYRVLLVSSSGGVLLDLLALEPWWSRHDPCWLAVRAADTEAALAGRRVHWVAEQSARRPLGVLTAALRAGRLLRRERPDVIVSAGSGVAVGVFLAASVLRIPALWLETLNLVGAPGLASRVCTRLAAAVLVQRPSLAPSRSRAVVLGELY